jgi:dinuclear metal center YbgI/SA1388 family protein
MLFKKIKELAPPENGLSGDLYGLQFGSILNSEDFNIHKIIVCLDPTIQVITEAIKQKIHLIISHHGIIHRPILNWNDLVLDQIKLLASNNIRLFVMHTAWDAAPEGVSETYAKTAGLNLEGPFYFHENGERKPIGRIGVPFQENTTIRDVCESLKRHLQLSHVQIVGDPDFVIKKAVVVGGKGLKADFITDVLNAGADTFITGEFTYADSLSAKALGLNLIATSHHSSEKIGMERLQQLLAVTFPRDEFIFVDSDDPSTFL